MKKNSTVAKNRNEIFKQPKLTIGLDLGDRSSHYCILDEAGNVILEHNLPTTPKGIHHVFSRIPRCRIALETGTHSPWVSRQLTQLGHEVIVAHARNVRLIGESSRKDDQLDARTLARLARIDPGLLGPVRHRSAQAQIHLTVIRARAALGLKLAERGGKNAKKRAVVAVARKLAVLLHKLWVSGEVYEPLRNNHKVVSAVA